MFALIGVAAAFALMAGLNLPLAALLTAVSVRLDLADFGTNYPGLAPLGSTYFLIIAGGLAILEFILDRIPRLDSVWDYPNAIIRPAGAAVGTYMLVSPTGGVAMAVIAAVLVATSALAVHLFKAALRIRLNRAGGVSRNVLVSSAEDVFVIGVAAFMVHFPSSSLALTIPVLAATIRLYPNSLRVRSDLRSAAAEKNDSPAG